MLSTKRYKPTGRPLPVPRIFRPARGLTLLELIIAFVVLQIALIAFAQLMTRALDYSRSARRQELAKMVAQTKMEELLRTIPERTDLAPQVVGEPLLLNERPGAFDHIAYGHSEDISPFMWVAETEVSKSHPKLLNVTLRVYLVNKRTQSGKSDAPVDDFFITDDRKRFTYKHSSLDGTVEVMTGKEKLSVASAVALPQS